jgi:outer membrane protein assembly factor BamB
MKTAWCVLSVCTLLISGSLQAADWPQWLGPDRDSVYRETGILKTMPEDGLKVLWRAPVELGYSGPAVADGKVYVTDYVKTEGTITNNPGGADKLQGKERILCFDAKSGEPVWKHEYDRPYSLSYPGGPRCTPTVVDGLCISLGAEGDLVCLDAKSGELKWHVNFAEKFGAVTPIWGYASHPLVHGNLVYTMVGGDGSVVVAFDKLTGREVWRALDAPEPGYCPPSIITHNGEEQLLVWHPLGLNGLNPVTGEVYWSFSLEPSFRMSIAVPRKVGDKIFASAYSEACALFRIQEDGRGTEEIWRGRANNAMYCANSTPFVTEEMAYGCDANTGALMGVKLADAARLWQTTEPTGGGRRDRHATAFIVKHEDRYILFNEKGDLIFCELSPEGYKEIGTTHLIDPTESVFGREVVWVHPAFANKCCYVRNDKEMICVSLAAE